MKHPLDPARGRDTLCPGGCAAHPRHCHCDYHDGAHGCVWGNQEFIRRLGGAHDDNRERLHAHLAANALAVHSAKATGEIIDMTVEEFRALPYRETWDSKEEPFDCLVILPAAAEEETHDSGFRCLDFVAVRDGQPICRLSGVSDVISLDGIGGMLHPNDQIGVDWDIDCLPKSGLLRIWWKGLLICGAAMSTFELYRRNRH